MELLKKSQNKRLRIFQKFKVIINIALYQKSSIINEIKKWVLVVIVVIIQITNRIAKLSNLLIILIKILLWI